MEVVNKVTVTLFSYSIILFKYVNHTYHSINIMKRLTPNPVLQPEALMMFFMNLPDNM